MNTPPKTRRCPDFATILREGEPDAALTEQVIRCFSTQMLRAAHFRCKNPSLAEDAFQEAVRITLEALPQYRGDAALESWLYKLVHSACSRLRRGRKNDPAYNRPLDDVPPEAEADPGPPEQLVRVLLGERLEILALLLQSVEEPNRSLFLLHEGDEVPLADLAARFDLTIDGVKSRLKRTRSALRERLTQIADGREAV